MRNLETKDEFLTEYSRFAGVTKTSAKYFMDALGAFIEECIENNVSFQYASVIELYFSEMKSRKTVKVGTKDEMVSLPPTIKARVRLAKKIRKKQTEFSRMMRPVLEDFERENREDLPLTEG